MSEDDSGAPDKDALAKEKLEREVEELRQAPIRARHAQRMALITTLVVAALSAVTSLTVAYSSYRMNALAQTTAAATHREETYAKLITDLGSDNVEARVGAAVGLAPYARDDNERRDQTIAILTTLLTTEKSSQVLQVLISSLVHAGSPAIDRVVEANRYAAQQYAADARDATLSHMDNFYAYSEMALKTKPDGSPAQSSDDIGTRFKSDGRDRFDRFVYPQIESQIDLGLLTEQERKALMKSPDGGNGNTRPIAILHDALFSLASGPLGDFAQTDSAFDELNNLNVITSANEQAQGAKRLPDETRAMYLTGIVLSRLLSSDPAAMRQKNTQGMVLIGANLADLHAAGLKLNGTFIVGDASGTDLSGAELLTADLTFLNLSRANLSHTWLMAAVLPLNAALFKTDFTGADWWNSSNADTTPDKNVFVSVVASRAHPGVTGSQTQSCANEDPAITFCAALQPVFTDDMRRRFPRKTNKR